MNPLITRILTKIDALLSKQAEPEKETPPSSDQAARLKALQDAMAEMRQLLQRTGAGFGAGATAVLAGLGYAQLHQVFPIPPAHHDATLIAALLGVILAFGGAVFLSGRFFSAQRRIVVEPQLGGDDIGRKDLPVQAKIYRAVALEEGAPSVEALELRARRLERIARQTTDKDTKAKLEAEASRITDAYRWAMRFAAASILERRSRDAFRGSRPFALIFAAGIIHAFGAADYAKGERDKIALFKDCEAAIAAGASEACGSIRDKSTTDKQTAKDDKAKDASSAALKAARVAFKNVAGKSRLERLEACSRVLLATPGFKADADRASASVVNACLNLITNG
jgi:hypothetical protein